MPAKFINRSELYNMLTREGSNLTASQIEFDSKIMEKHNACNKTICEVWWSGFHSSTQYEGFLVKDLLKFASFTVNIKRYMTDYKYFKEPNKEWLCNL